MKMSTNDKFTLFLILALIGVWTCRQLQPSEKKDELIFDNIHIPRKPCISAINDLLGKGVDSSKACDCLLTSFYNLIKNDSLLVKEFENSGTAFELQHPLNDSFNLLMATCVRQNILDSNHKFNLPPEYEVAFKEKLKKGFKLQKDFEEIETDLLSDCIVNKVNGNITVSEYFSDDYFEIPRIRKMMLDCIESSKR